MEMGMWIYPWDILDGGAEYVIRQLCDYGIGDIHLAASYHSVLAVLPHNPQRRTYLAEHAALYFQPYPERWRSSRMQPMVSPLVASSGDALAVTAPLCKQLGVRLTAWTVCLHNTFLVQRYPETSVVNLWGERYPCFCVANPHVRAYTLALVNDLRDRVDLIELEAAHWLAFPHHQHAKIGVPAAKSLQLLLGLCFCEHCQVRMRVAGLDVTSLRHRLCTRLDNLPTEPIKDSETQIAALCEAEPELVTLLALRRDTVTELITELKAIAGSTPLTCIVSGPEWATGADPTAIIEIVDRLVIPAYGSPMVVSTTMGTMAMRIGQAAMKQLVVGLSLLAPETKKRTTLRAAVEVSRAAGVAGICFYNYGLAPLNRIRWLEAVI